ncbi:Protein SYM1 [Fusarium oxysporum f. sp. cubense]|uniref:Protein SYM1 n=1 Tax=Fusarium oxysporum f. sp. cubense TaxID=61366 RepID=A0A559LN00_FUSOC|nr:Protein SYM1 [Fusarium oxysporum f. sp. cubense]
MASFIRWYNARLAACPLLTQSVTIAFLFATGDVTAQQLAEKKGVQKHDLVRTGRMALYRGCVFGPVAITWFAFLARNINVRNKKAEVLTRVACDQLGFAHVMIGVFLGSMATMEANWMLWPAVQVINFSLIPLQHRLFFANIIAIGWNSYLSWVNTRSQ